MQASYIMSIFIISIVMIDFREALPKIDDTNIKLIVDGEHNEIITEHEVGFVTGKPISDRFDVPESGIPIPDPIETSESKHLRRRIHRLNSRLGFPLFNTGFPMMSLLQPLLGFFG